MKRLLLTTILAFALSCVRIEATVLTADYIGETYVTTNNVERSLIVNSDDGTYYNIAIRPLEEEITNSDGTVSIPLEYLFINNNREDVYLKYNEYSNIFYGAEMDGIPRNMTAKIKEYGIVPAGTYSILLEIQATNIETEEIACTTSFSLQFIVPTVHQLTSFAEAPKITISASNAFSRGTKITSETKPIIYIRSNTDWILTLDPANFPDNINGKFYIRTISGTSKVTSRLQEDALITPGGSEIVLARGIAPSDNEQVSLELAVENPTEGAIEAGEYDLKLKYILREGDEG